jgi:hypothetical protein
MTDLELAIMIKNVARETVWRMTVKNSTVAENKNQFSSKGFLLDSSGTVAYLVSTEREAKDKIAYYKRQGIDLEMVQGNYGYYLKKK